MFDRIDRIVEENRYSKHSFVQALTTGDVPVERVRAWAIQKTFQTYEQNRCFSAIHSHAPYEDVRQLLIQQLLAEETGLVDGTEPHYALMRRFALAVGATDRDFGGTPMAGPVRQFVDYLVGTCRDRHFVWGLLAVYINESQTPDAVTRLWEHFAHRFGFDDHTLEWFAVHAEGDVEHAASARRLIEKYHHEIADFESDVDGFVQRGCRRWLALHDCYYSLVTATAPASSPEEDGHGT